MASPVVSPADAARFWSKVARSEGCWEWTAGRNRGGYGQFQIGRRPWPAHRVSWVIANGPIPDGVLCLHRCDNPPCVRPDHLHLGDVQDNADDRRAHGRPSKPPDYLLSLRGAAESLGIAPATLRQQIRRGRLDAMYPGAWLVRASEIERYRAESLGKPGRRHSSPRR